MSFPLPAISPAGAIALSSARVREPCIAVKSYTIVRAVTGEISQGAESREREPGGTGGGFHPSPSKSSAILSSDIHEEL